MRTFLKLLFGSISAYFSQFYLSNLRVSTDSPLLGSDLLSTMWIHISLLQCSPVSLQQLSEFLALLFKPSIKHKKSIPHRKSSLPTTFAAGTDDEHWQAKKGPHHTTSASGRFWGSPGSQGRSFPTSPSPGGGTMSPRQRDALRELHTNLGAPRAPSASSGAQADGKASALCCNSHIWALLKPEFEDVKHMLDCQPSSMLHWNRQESRLPHHRRGWWGPGDAAATLTLVAESCTSHSKVQTPAVPKHTQPCWSPQTKMVSTALSSGLRWGEVWPNTLTAPVQYQAQTGAFCSLQWGLQWAQNRMGAGARMAHGIGAHCATNPEVAQTGLILT